MPLLLNSSSLGWPMWRVTISPDSMPPAFLYAISAIQGRVVDVPHAGGPAPADVELTNRQYILHDTRHRLVGVLGLLPGRELRRTKQSVGVY
ncbi:hypothetical protein GC163_01495 [bacterium]|nr:hypothetical protein [bacterium]